MRISVFDPHPVIHKALTSQLPEHGFSVVSLALDGRDAVQIIRQAAAEVVITEINMPFCDGLKLLESVHDAKLGMPCLVYTADTNPTFVARSIAWGARDYVLKTEPFNALLETLNNIANPSGETRNKLFRSIRRKMQNREIPHRNPRDLTNREMQVLRHLGFGLSNREIATSLEISVETVKEHVQNILRKLDSSDRTEAAVWAVRDGLS